MTPRRPTAARLRRTAQGAATLVGVVAAAATLSTPALIDAGDDPCVLATMLFCRLLPIAPDLDDDIDLTQRTPSTDEPPPVLEAPATAKDFNGAAPAASGSK